MPTVDATVDASTCHIVDYFSIYTGYAIIKCGKTHSAQFILHFSRRDNTSWHVYHVAN